MNGLGLCAGVGGLELGLRLALGERYRCIALVEREAYAASVLAARMADGLLDHAPIWSDLESFPAAAFHGLVDIVSAGFPCQPWSVAGQRRGTNDERWLWPAIARCIRVVRPRYVFVENVPGLLAGGLGHVLSDLAECGFNAEWDSFTAAQVGAPHLRERVFLLARLAVGQADGHGRGWPGLAEPDGGTAQDRRDGEDRRHAKRRDPVLADPAERGRRAGQPDALSGREQSDATGSGEPVADTGSKRWRGWDADTRWQAGSATEGLERVGADVGHASCDGQRWAGLPTERSSSPARGSGRDVGDSHIAGPQRWRLPGDERADEWAAGEAVGEMGNPGLSVVGDVRGERRDEAGSRGREVFAGVSGYPPRPDDTEGWRCWLAAGGPSPVFRGGTDGLPCRVDRLRALGNAVVPAQAAYAFSVLWRRLHDG